jgi:hypothetical protein
VEGRSSMRIRKSLTVFDRRLPLAYLVLPGIAESFLDPSLLVRLPVEQESSNSLPPSVSVPSKQVAENGSATAQLP